MRRRGFTLIELMVGMVIGLLATVVIAQVLLASEARRRTTVSGSDSQVSGALSMYSLQRELQMAGYGVTTSLASLGCEIRAQYGGTDFTLTLAPLIITAGASGAPDTIQVVSSAKATYAVPARVVTDHPRTAANFFINTTLGMAVGDLMLAVPQVWDASNWCSVFNISNIPSGNTQINHNSGGAGPWNQPGGQTIFPTAGYPAGSILRNLGQFTTRTFSVSSNNNLRVATFTTTNATTSNEDLHPDIVQLQALYGKDTNADGTIDTWDKTTPTTNAGWRQVLAVRVAIVARSSQREKDNVTSANPQWDVGSTGTGSLTGVAACGASNCVPIVVDTLTDWQRYRYKVYDSIIPLRNVLWRT